MDKEVLIQYSDAKARIKLLREQVQKKRIQLDKLNEKGYVVSDVVSCGKRGKKPLGTIRITGHPLPASERAKREYQKQYNNLMNEEQELLELQTRVEEYIADIPNVEIRNLMTLHYVDNLNWVQVACQMNRLYHSKGKSYTDGSCRLKHDRFIEKI